MDGSWFLKAAAAIVRECMKVVERLSRKENADFLILAQANELGALSRLVPAAVCRMAPPAGHVCARA
jgi:hypothetical protein